MVNINTLSLSEFNKYISRQDLSDDDFKKIFEDLNEKYMEDSKEVLEINERRSETLDKIRNAQLVYKKHLGNNEINLEEVLLYIRIGLTKKNEEELFGRDINNNQIYGYIPINEFNISFDYDVL